MRRPADRDWRLTVRDGTLVLDAPHGTFAVRGMDAAVAREVATYPDDVELVCRGEYDGAANIEGLVVTKITSVISELVPRSPTDSAVRADPSCARARAAERLGVGDIPGAAEDLAIALRGHAAHAEDVYAALPDPVRAQLVASYALWANSREPLWRTLRWLPLARWSNEHVRHALAWAVARSGRFGDITGEDLAAELDRRDLEHARDAKKLAKLRRAQATEGGVAFRIDSPLHEPRVVGATRDVVWIAGKLELGPAPSVPPGARRELARTLRPAVIAYDTDGREVARYVDVVADRVLDGYAIHMYPRTNARWRPGVRRLADNAIIVECSAVTSYDDKTVECSVDRDFTEIRDLATGDFIERREPTQVTIVKTVVAPNRKSFGVRSTDESRFHGWYLFDDYKRFYVGPTDGALAILEPAKGWRVRELVPPWLAFEHKDSLVLVALGELMTCSELRVDGNLVAKRVR